MNALNALGECSQEMIPEEETRLQSIEAAALEFVGWDEDQKCYRPRTCWEYDDDPEVWERLAEVLKPIC
jgi:hypothetical protein